MMTRTVEGSDTKTAKERWKDSGRRWKDGEKTVEGRWKDSDRTVVGW